MKKIKSGFILPSAVCNIKKNQIKFRNNIEKTPEIGDLVYGTVLKIGKHTKLENGEGRLHTITEGTKSIFVYGNRYAPDAFEGIVPTQFKIETDILAGSGLIGELVSKNSNISSPTKVKIYGYVCNQKGEVLNTKLFPKIKTEIKPQKIKSKLILCIGSAMNSGKSLVAAKCCWALNAMGHHVNACKITGTASLKDILLMEDSGAQNVADFTYLGYPSTYMLKKEEIIKIFNNLDFKFASKTGYWVVEIADGILQREAKMLLESKELKNRIHKVVYCGKDAVGIIGGLSLLKEKYNIVPDGLSGLFSSSPLAIQELEEFVDLPHFDSMKNDLNDISKILME